MLFNDSVGQTPLPFYVLTELFCVVYLLLFKPKVWIWRDFFLVVFYHFIIIIFSFII